jgi:hypothetical protein
MRGAEALAYGRGTGELRCSRVQAKSEWKHPHEHWEQVFRRAELWWRLRDARHVGAHWGFARYHASYLTTTSAPD